MINSASVVYFSPTNTSKTIVEIIAFGTKIENITHIDLTLNSKNFDNPGNDLTIFSVLVYCGRLPAIAINRLNKIKGNNTPAIIVAVYGNRNFDDALLELKNIVTDQGFKPFADAAFIGEHSFTSEHFPIATGRPDKNDLIKAIIFGTEIRKIITEHNGIDKIVEVPGNYPYKVINKMPDISPITIDSKCDKCGICLTACPTGSITLNNMIETDKNTCILCCACIKVCPNNARLNDNDLIKISRE